MRMIFVVALFPFLANASEPSTKAMAIESYNLARNLEAQGKYALCLTELEKVHKIFRTYENSLELQNRCRQGLKIVGCQTDPRCALTTSSDTQTVKDAIARALKLTPPPDQWGGIVAIFNAGDFSEIYSGNYMAEAASFHLDLRTGDLVYRSKKCKSASALAKAKTLLKGKQICIRGGSLMAKCTERPPSNLDHLCLKNETEICLNGGPLRDFKYTGCGLSASFCKAADVESASVFFSEMKTPPKDLKCH